MGKDPFEFREEKNRQIVEFVAKHPNKYTVPQLAERFSVSTDKIASVLRRAKRHFVIQVLT
jgi:DeoR/GlpR family transcriptional regulator of sugar metabolism